MSTRPEQAARDLGIGVPAGFLYLGGGEAMVIGTADDMLAAARILDAIDTLDQARRVLAAALGSDGGQA